MLWNNSSSPQWMKRCWGRILGFSYHERGIHLKTFAELKGVEISQKYSWQFIPPEHLLFCLFGPDAIAAFKVPLRLQISRNEPGLLNNNSF